MTEVITKQDAPMDSEVSASPQEAVIPVEKSTNNADNSSAVDPEVEGNPSAGSQSIYNNNNQIQNPMEQFNNEQTNEQQEVAQVTNPTEEVSAVAEPTILKKQVIYSSEDLKSLQVKIAYLKVNRDINVEAVKKKIKSINVSGGIITPSMIVPARTCLDEGLEVKLKDSTPITTETPNLDLIYVIIDGQHRQDAVERIAENAKSGETTYNNFFFIPLTNKVKVSDLLREANVVTYPWKDQQYLSNLIMMKDGNTSVKLDFLKEILSHPEAKTKALVRWFSLDNGRNLYSRDIITASVDDAKLAEIANVNEERFNGGKLLYELLSKKFASSEPGKTVYAEWVIDRFSDETSVSFKEVLNYLEQFFNSLTPTQIIELKEAKGTRDPYETRDGKVKAILTKNYNKYKAKHPIESSK